MLLAGHAIGIIVAETEAAAQAAARAVVVTYQGIVPVLSIDQAIEAGSFFEVATYPISDSRKISEDPRGLAETNCCCRQCELESNMAACTRVHQANFQPILAEELHN